MSIEQKSWSPLWLEFSGLPTLLAQKFRSGAGWTIFKKIVELDCAANTNPEAVEITVLDLAARCGLEPATARKTILALRKLKLIACFLPETDEEEALLKIQAPLPTPLTPEEIRARHPRLFSEPPPQRFRYSAADSIPDDPHAAEKPDPLLQEIVDLYFNAVGMKMNAFVLDELRLIRHRFPMDRVRRTFRRAQQNEIRSLGWVVRELVRMEKKDGQTDPTPPSPVPHDAPAHPAEKPPEEPDPFASMERTKAEEWF